MPAVELLRSRLEWDRRGDGRGVTNVSITT